MRRGEIVTAVFPGAYGKPRPALLIQADVFEALPSATLLPITSDLRDLPPIRIDIEPGPESGLRRSSQIMVDKVQTIPRARLGNRLGSLSEEAVRRVDEALGRFLGLR
ncbi:MAG: type II toxin-antitoxin system PemK/MazF family toxin [Longimicrobiales bacterium]